MSILHNQSAKYPKLHTEEKFLNGDNGEIFLRLF